MTVLSAACALLGAVPAFAATAPTGMVCTNGPSFALRATDGHIETPDGNSVYMWSYANDATGGSFQLPGPVLCVNQGDTVSVTLNNSLSTPVSIVFPGQEGVSATGGTPGLFTNEAAPAGQVTYTFTASKPGTYLYESGTDPSKQVEMGLYGALVVRPKVSDVPGGLPGHTYAYDDVRSEYNPNRESLLVFHEIDPDLHQAVENGQPYDFSNLHFRYYTVTGRAFPDTIQNNGVAWLPTQPYGSLVRAKPYDPTLNPLPAMVRIVNAGLYNHPFHPHGFHLQIIAQDGRLFRTPSGGDASTEHFGDVVPAGASQDALFTYVDKDKFCAGTACTAAGYATQNPLPVTIPSYRNLTFKGSQTWFSGSPYLGAKGTLPTLVTSFNVCGEFYFPWHSHALNEFVNYDEGFGGLATLLRIDPLPGCTAFPASTKIVATPPNTAVSGTLVSGSNTSLNTDDGTSYTVNSTATATPPAPNSFKTDWYAGFTGIAQGALNPKLTYKGKCSATCVQKVSIWNWRTQAWVQLDSRSVGTAGATINSLAVPPSPSAGNWSDYISTGTNSGQARIRVYSTRTAGAFTTRGNFMKLVYDAP